MRSTVNLKVLVVVVVLEIHIDFQTCLYFC